MLNLNSGLQPFPDLSSLGNLRGLGSLGGSNNILEQLGLNKLGNPQSQQLIGDSQA